MANSKFDFRTILFELWKSYNGKPVIALVIQREESLTWHFYGPVLNFGWEYLALTLLNPSLDECLRLEDSASVFISFFYRHFSDMKAAISTPIHKYTHWRKKKGKKEFCVPVLFAISKLCKWSTVNNSNI